MIHFYCFVQTKKIIISDLPTAKIKTKYGYRYEILTSIKDKSNLDIVTQKIQRSYSGFTFEYNLLKEKTPLTDEQRKKISDSKIGKPRDPETRAKISAALKGRSNFQGKRHNDGTKRTMSEKKLGNDHTKDYYWAHDPRSDKEIRVKSLDEIPVGFKLGRDHYSTEAGLYYFREASTNSPKGKRSN